MKRSRCSTGSAFRSRILSVLLVLVMVFAMLPAFTQTASAASITDPYSTVYTDGGKYLKETLSRTDNVKVVLMGDIDYKDNGDYEYWCTIVGNKIIDLNGHSITIHNDDVYQSTLFRVPSNSTLIVTADPDSDLDDVKITYNGYINDLGYCRQRNLFEVYGRMVVNGGKLEAGRSKKFYSASQAGYYYKQTKGSAVIIKNGGILVVNGGELTGRGSACGRMEQSAGIVAKSGSYLFFNGGYVHGRGGGNAFVID